MRVFRVVETAICCHPLVQNCRYYEDATVAWICILIEVGE